MNEKHAAIDWEATRPPRLTPEGKCNAEYDKWYRVKRKAEGNPVKRIYDPEYQKTYRKTLKGKEAMKRHRESRKARGLTSKRSRETPEAYATRIIGELERRDRRFQDQ
jgi:hypothetical protein